MMGLETDFYQLTMAHAGWKQAQSTSQSQFNVQSCFELGFRTNPFGGGYGVFCGIESALQFIENWTLTDEDCAFLRSLRTGDGQPQFEAEFIEDLRRTRFEVDLESFQEGEVCFATEPLVRVTGPLWQCLFLETPLLNMIGFQTLIATKASRVKFAAGDDQVLEFGLRRAQGLGAGELATRAAYIGGVDATSNIAAALRFGVPLRGTHSHAWVMAHGSESEAFENFARNTNSTVSLLVDTYRTEEGIENAISVLKGLPPEQLKSASIRLDSGDLAFLSLEARKRLDAVGLSSVKIVASNDLDESLIESLKFQGAQIDVWGVGTRLVTGHQQGALGAVYKLCAIRDGEGAWVPKLKVSENRSKTTLPGRHQVRRFFADGVLVGDLIELEQDGSADSRGVKNTGDGKGIGKGRASVESQEPWVLVDPNDETRQKKIETSAASESLLRPMMKKGVRTSAQRASSEHVKVARDYAQSRVAMLHPTIRRLVNPHLYPVGVTVDLYQMRKQMILEAK